MIVEALYGWAHKVKYRHGLQGAEPLSVENLHNVVIKTSHLRFILIEGFGYVGKVRKLQQPQTNTF